MEEKIEVQSIYRTSEDVVAREIEGELIIVPLVSGIADLEDDLFTLNKTGKEIWKRLDGKRSIQDIIKDLSSDFDNPSQIETDVIGFLEELLKRKIIVRI